MRKNFCKFSNIVNSDLVTDTSAAPVVAVAAASTPVLAATGPVVTAAGRHITVDGPVAGHIVGPVANHIVTDESVAIDDPIAAGPMASNIRQSNNIGYYLINNFKRLYICFM